MANKSSKVDEYAHLIGCVPDKIISELAGLSTAASVQNRRKKIKAESFRKNHTRIQKAKLTWEQSDEEIAKDLDVPEALVKVVRYTEEIKKNKVETTEKHNLNGYIVDAVLEKIGATKPKKASAKKATTKKTSAKKATTKKSSAKKATTKKSSAKKTSAKKASDKKATTEKASAKKASTKKPTSKKVTKKTSVKKAPSKKTTKKTPVKASTKTTKKDTPKVTKTENNVILSRMFLCVFAEGENTSSIHIVADTFEGASRKAAAVGGKMFAKAALKSIQDAGQAIL